MNSSNWTTRSERPRYLEWLGLFSAYLILTYAIRKLIGPGQFAWGAGLDHREVGMLSGEELTWFYFGYSHAYGTILGLPQFVGGTFLLFRRSALLGATVLTPVMVNILMINLFFYVAVGAELVAVFVLVSCILLLCHERRVLFNLFWSRRGDSPSSGIRGEKIAAFIVVLLLIFEAILFAKHPAL
jgi:hypothetical protein